MSRSTFPSHQAGKAQVALVVDLIKGIWKGRL